MPESVTFYVNGPARLLMSCIIAEEYFPVARKTLILLDQFGYNYDRLLPHVEDRFERVVRFEGREKRYTHLGQFAGTYLRRYAELKGLFEPGGHAVLFGLRSPVQKFIIRENRRLGNGVDIYAESIAVDRYFDAGFEADGPGRQLARKLFARAFDYQHDYDRFFLHVPALYPDAPQAPKFRPMPRLYRTESAARYADILLRDVDLDGLDAYETVFLGQPLSNFDGTIAPAAEEAILKRILGDGPVLILPHPNERIGAGGNKYAALPGARIVPPGAPNDLICQRLRPKRTITYASTIGVEYALSNPDSENLFYPVLPSSHRALARYAAHIPNLTLSDAFVSAGARVGGGS